MYDLVDNPTRLLERNSDPSEHVLTIIFQQLTIPRIRVSDSSLDLSLDASKIQSGIKDQHRVVCDINLFPRTYEADGDLRQIPAE
jgi:hypothetical protein